jgi:proteasome lid subunit RPN8/RPN11
MTPAAKPDFDLHRLRDARQLGVLRRDGAVVVIVEPVLEEILEFSERDLNRETGGFLLGSTAEDEVSSTIIRGFFPAQHVASKAGSLTFTHDTWATLHRQAEQRFPGQQIVGWHHTHPGFGIFLSAHDLFIHRHFFSQPHQVALVVDPRRGEFGFFHWRRSEIYDCGFVCVEC